MDDILVWGHSQEEHDFRLYAVLQRIKSVGFTLNTNKCALSQSVVKFLGHIILDVGIQPGPAKTAVVRNIPKPANIIVNQLGKSISWLAQKDKPLRDLL